MTTSFGVQFYARVGCFTTSHFGDYGPDPIQRLLLSTQAGARVRMDGRYDVRHRVDLCILLLLRSPPHGKSCLYFRRVREAFPPFLPLSAGEGLLISVYFFLHECFRSAWRPHGGLCGGGLAS